MTVRSVNIPTADKSFATESPFSTQASTVGVTKSSARLFATAKVADKTLSTSTFFSFYPPCRRNHIHDILPHIVFRLVLLYRVHAFPPAPTRPNASAVSVESAPYHEENGNAPIFFSLFSFLFLLNILILPPPLCKISAHGVGPRALIAFQSLYVYSNMIAREPRLLSPVIFSTARPPPSRATEF